MRFKAIMPMSIPRWNLVDCQARAEVGPFVAQLNLLDPAQGLRLTSRNPATDLRLLGVTGPELGPTQREALVDPHVRGGDLLAGYRPAAGREVYIDAVWRIRTPVDDPRAGPAFELTVAVRTAHLESNPQVLVSSLLPGAELLVPADAELTQFAPVPSGGQIAADRPGCYVHRLANLPLSYLEMLSPRDVRCTRVESLPAQHLVHRLFPCAVEKGVILCARLRGFLTARDGDTQRARVLYQQFASPEELL